MNSQDRIDKALSLLKFGSSLDVVAAIGVLQGKNNQMSERPALKTYEVTIMRTAYATYFIDAESEESARELVWLEYHGEADDCAEHTIYNIEEIEKDESHRAI